MHILRKEEHMKNIFRILGSMAVLSLIPAVSGAVGTYYNGNLYQNPQQRYSRGGYYNSYGYGAGRGGYGQQQNVQSQLGTQKQQNQKKTVAKSTEKQGFVLDAGLSHEMAKWEFEMNNAGSKLHYDNLAWNVFDVQGAYYFGGDTKMQVKAGFKYGMQFGETSMIDDDISNSNAIFTEEEADINGYTGNTISGVPAMSIGTSKKGTQMGFNIGFGLTDFFTWGKVKATPSIGYRYFKHKVKTSNNVGMSVDVLHAAAAWNCVSTYKDEVQCEPIVMFGNGYDENGDLDVLVYGGLTPVKWEGSNLVPWTDGDDEEDFAGYVSENYDTNYYSTGRTYYYEQPGTSHEYETTWAGPYIALDLNYQINDNNAIVAGIEFGLPTYTSEGIQPYRIDWKQSPSVKDEGKIGDAYHLALNMNWMTAITDSMMLDLGFSYDYYKVSGATANTYWVYEGTQADNNEIDSVYKSMGIRAGLNVRF